jgi:hypothetical protein
MKQKKLKISYFLNDRLKITVLDGNRHYPVYTRVVFNRTSTIFPFPEASLATPSDYKKHFEKRENPWINKSIERFENMVEKIVRFEYNLTGEKYSVSGLNLRLRDYEFGDILSGIDDIMHIALLVFLKDKVSEQEWLSVSHKSLTFIEAWYLAADNFFPMLLRELPDELATKAVAFAEFMVFCFIQEEQRKYKMLDWLSSDLQTEFKSFLLTPDKPYPDKLINNPSLSRFYNDYRSKPIQTAACMRAMDLMVLNSVKYYESSVQRMLGKD